MTASSLSEDEIVATIQRSDIPTVLVEGSTDMTIYRWIENDINIAQLTVLPCDGRNRLLSVYMRRSEFAGKAVAFVADRDMWVFTAVPSDYRDVVFTAGYSIENDALASAGFERLLDPAEAPSYQRDKEALITWFAFVAEEFRVGRIVPCACHINRILDADRPGQHLPYVEACGFKAPASSSTEELRNDYYLKVRGKNVVELLLRYLSSRTRQTKHSRNSLLETACKMVSPHPQLSEIATLVRRRLSTIVTG